MRVVLDLLHEFTNRIVLSLIHNRMWQSGYSEVDVFSFNIERSLIESKQRVSPFYRDLFLDPAQLERTAKVRCFSGRYDDQASLSTLMSRPTFAKASMSSHIIVAKSSLCSLKTKMSSAHPRDASQYSQMNQPFPSVCHASSSG